MVTAQLDKTDRLEALVREVSSVSENASLALAHLCEAILERRERAAFVARAAEAVAEAAEYSTEDILNEVAGAPSNFAVLYQILNRPEVLDALRLRDPLAPARLRGLRARERMLSEEGGTLTSAEMAAALGITRQAVDHRRRTGKLIGLNVGRRGYLYPAWQVGPRGVLDGLPDVLAVMEDDDPWTHIIFMLGHNQWIDGERPLDALRRGETDQVVLAARHYGEQVAL
jgi:hypothetical protein